MYLPASVVSLQLYNKDGLLPARLSVCLLACCSCLIIHLPPHRPFRNASEAQLCGRLFRLLLKLPAMELHSRKTLSYRR